MNGQAYATDSKPHESNTELMADILRDYYGIGYISSSELLYKKEFSIVHIKATDMSRQLFLCSQSNIDNLPRDFLTFCQSIQANRIIKDMQFMPFKH